MMLPKTEHSLRLWTGALMWLSMTAAIIGLSYIPDLVPENADFWRISLGGSALIFVALHIPAYLYLTETQSYRATVIGAYLGTAVFIVLLQITPASWALLMGLMVPGIFVGYFLRMRELFPLLIFLTAVALSSLLVPVRGRDTAPRSAACRLTWQRSGRWSSPCTCRRTDCSTRPKRSRGRPSPTP